MATWPAATVLAAFLVAFLVPYVGAALWVRRDANRRGSERATRWATRVLVGLPVFPLVVAAYLLRRPAADASTPPPERIDRVLRNVVIASVLSFAVVAVASPPDPFAQADAIAVALPGLVFLAVLAAYQDVLASAR